jgi:hypothetical protein
MKPGASRALVAGLIAVGMTWSVSLDGQPASVRARVDTMAGTSVVKKFIASRMAKGFVPPKTPWGDPDISGNFDTSPEANTPLERPDEWAGRDMDSISGKELAEAIERRQRAAVESAPFAGGGEAESGIALAVPIHWFDNLAAVNSRPWFVIDPPDGRIPPPTAATVARQEAAARAQAEARKAPDFRLGGRRDHYSDRSPNERCINPFPELWRTPTIYGNAHQILQTPDFVVFRSEMIHEARIIPLDGRPHLGPSVKTNVGDSRGYWDGHSLVVETVNIRPITTVRGAPGVNMRIVERFTRMAPDKVEWTVTLDDPTVWTRPWTYSYPMTVNDAKPIFEYACQEGNYGMANLLSAGRLADQQGGFGKQ